MRSARFILNACHCGFCSCETALRHNQVMSEESPQGTGVLVWEFEGESEADAYSSLRNEGVFRRSTLMTGAMWLMVLFVVPAAFTVHWSLSIVALVLIVGLFQYSELRRGYWIGKYGLTKVEIQLEYKKISLVEWYGDFGTVVGAEYLPGKSLGRWSFIGCHFDLSVMKLMQNRLLIPIQFFSDEESVDVFQKWAVASGVRIEGRFPLESLVPRLAEEESEKNELIWEFADDQDVARYFRLRRRKLFRGSKSGEYVSSFLIFFALFYMTLPNWYIPLIAAVFLIVVNSISAARTNGTLLKSGIIHAKLHLDDGAIELVEVTGYGVKPVGKLRTSKIRFAAWHGDGCVLDSGQWNLTAPKVTLPPQFFDNPNSVRIFLAWAERNKIEIEGVPPLGIYRRPIEGELRP